MKRRDILIILGLIIVIDIIVFAIFKLTPEQEQRSVEYEISGGVGDGGIKRLELENVTVLGNVAGEMAISKLSGMITDIFETNLKTHVQETLEMDKAQLEEFYSKNVIRIDRELHLESKESYVNLISQAREVTCSLDEFDRCTFTDKEEFIEFVCTYENGDTIQGIIDGAGLSVVKIEF